MSVLRRFVMLVGEIASVLFIVVATAAGAAFARENAAMLAVKFGLADADSVRLATLAGAAGGFVASATLAAVLLALIETASNTRQLLRLLRQQQAAQRMLLQDQALLRDRARPVPPVRAG